MAAKPESGPSAMAPAARSEEHFRALYEALACGVMVRNTAGEVVDANRAAEKIFGIPLGQMLGRSTDEMWLAFAEDGSEIPPRQRPSMLAIERREAVRGFVMRVVPPTGLERWLQIDAVPLFNEEGRVHQIVASFIDISDRKRIEEALRRSEAALAHLALHDSLTGLPNRVLFHDRLEHAIRLGERHQQSFAVLFMDLNKFKDVNDSFGHDAGDFVLREIADRLRHELRASDTVARMGGDEFAFLLPAMSSTEAAGTTADKLLRAVTRTFQFAHQRIRLGAAIGIALFPMHGDDSKTLIRKADLAMYQAKGCGDPGCYKLAE